MRLAQGLGVGGDSASPLLAVTPLFAVGAAFALVLLLALCLKKKPRSATVVNKAVSSNPNVTFDDAPPAVQRAAKPAEAPKPAESAAGVAPTTTTTAAAPPIAARPRKSSAASHARTAAPAPEAAPPQPPRDASAKKAAPPVPADRDDAFGGFDVDGTEGAAVAKDGTVFDGFAAVDPAAATADGDDAANVPATAEHEAEPEVPVWYAGQLSRDVCEETVLAASKGDFLVRESSRGDRCVICINIGDQVLNLMVVSRDGKYRFAGKERGSLADVIFLLRLKTLILKSGPLKVAKAAPGLADAKKRDRQRQNGRGGASSGGGLAGAPRNGDDRRSSEKSRELEFRRGSASGRPLSESIADDLVFTSDDLYDAPAGLIDELGAEPGNEDEPLYVDMFDANIPSAEWIAREEERHRLNVAGIERLSNEEFGQLRMEARKRAETAARENRRKAEEAKLKSDIRAAWKKSEKTLAKGASLEEPAPAPAENFFDYQNASMREFGGYEEDEIYDSVPTWFAGKLSRETCDSAVVNGGPGTYVIRESSSGDRYIICINWGGVAKNFQIYITEDGSYRFSGQMYPDLQRLVSFLQKHGITKNGKTIALGRVAQW